ncbi:MAG: hypothetical protein H6563_05775 [Lewinellaceae bacterium]|nr:hypothetical protein [Lewinellaceae bacterium]
MRFFPALLIFFGAIALRAQPSLSDLTGDLAKAMQEVETAKATLSQSIETVKDKPYVIVYHLSTTSPKGRTLEEEWRFNLADIDSRSVRVEDGKDALRINLKMDKGQKYVQYFKDGSLTSYTDNLEFYGKDIDNARQIESLLLAAVPKAMAAWDQTANIEGLNNDQLLELLMKLVDDMELDGTNYRQRLTQMPDYPDRLNLNLVTSNARNSRQETYIWSLGDLKPGGVRINFSGDDALVEAVTKDNMPWVYVQEEGVQKDYAKAVYFRVPDADRGKQLVAVLEKLIPFGERSIQSRLPSPGNPAENFDRISASLGAFSVGKNSYNVGLEKKCQTRLTETQGSTNMEYAFHMGDLDPKSVKLEMDDDQVEIHVNTEKKADYIWVSKDGEQANYDDEIVIQVADVEKGRLIAYLLPTLIDQCPEEVNFGKFEDVEKWISDGKAPDTGISQTLSRKSGEEACKWKYVIRDNDEKKPSEESYEFNAYDLDPDQVRIEVNRKTVSVEVQTLRKQNIISSVVKEKPGFVSSLAFEVADIKSAKSLRTTLEQLIAECK